MSTMLTSIFVNLLTLIPTILSFPFPDTQFGYENPILSAPTKSPEYLSEVNVTSSSSLEEYCKTENDRNPWSNPPTYYVYDPITKNCYLASTKGPCQENMKFYFRSDDRNYGFCDCDQSIPAVYSEETGSCHILFHMEYCDSGSWLQYDMKNGLKCVENTCPDAESSDGKDYYVLYRGKCVRLGENCGGYKTIQFTSGKYEPVCAEVSLSNSAVGSSTPGVKCSSGSRWSALTNKCQQTVGFDLS